MGWDISYHPISEEQINRWYFDVLDNKDLIETLSQEFGIEDFYKEKYRETINIALGTSHDDIFEKTHAYYIAVVQGFFEKFFYIRGGALSFSESGNLDKYFKKWEEILPADKLTANVHNRIIENYCAGVFVPAEKVSRLLEDYQNNSTVKAELDGLFSHGRINIILKALEYAKEKGVGILEATEVLEPNPMDLNRSSCYSNLFNCDPEGALLYRDAVMEQLSQIEDQKEDNIETTETSVETKEKEGFWKKLFGK